MSDNPFEQRRAERRYAMNFLDFEVIAADGETVGRGLARTLNVSATGLLLETGQFFEAGQLLRVTLGLRNKLVQLTGRVAHSHPVNDDLCNTGIQFVEFAPADRQVFQAYVEALPQPAAG